MIIVYLICHNTSFSPKITWASMGLVKNVCLGLLHRDYNVTSCVLSHLSYSSVIVFPYCRPPFPHAVMLSVPQNKSTSNKLLERMHFLPGLFDLTLWASGLWTRLPFSGTALRLEVNLPAAAGPGHAEFHFSPSPCRAEWRGGDQSSPRDELCKGRLISSHSACHCHDGWFRDEEDDGEVQEAAIWDGQAGWGEPAIKG